MLFPLDIAFLNGDLVVTEVYRNVAPGYLVRSELPARYFLEVNASELEGVDAGSQASVELSSPGEVSVAPGLASAVSFAELAVVVSFAAGMIKNIAGRMFTGAPKTPAGNKAPSFDRESKQAAVNRCAFCRGWGEQCEVCERISPGNYHILSWVGAPVPDYSFAVEPEVRERKIDEVLKRLKEGVDSIQQSDNFRKFLLTMSKFHDYSIGNVILIMLQKPSATRVAGFNTWKNLGRWVKPGEKGIAILAPCMPPKEKKPRPTEGAEDEELRPEEETELRPLYFKVVHVFDVSQTEGKPLPEFEVPSLTGEANEDLFSRVMLLAESQGVAVSFEPRPNQDPEIKGIYFGKTIWVKPDEPRAQQLKTLLHEMAHYFSESVFRIPRSDAETIAESVAFTAGAHFGFDTGNRSFPYVAVWSRDKKTLEANLAAIRKVSAKIIDGIEEMANKMAGVASK